MRGFFGALRGHLATEVGLGGSRRCLFASLLWRGDAGGLMLRLEGVSRAPSSPGLGNCQGFRWADACRDGKAAPGPYPAQAPVSSPGLAPVPAPAPPGPRVDRPKAKPVNGKAAAPLVSGVGWPPGPRKDALRIWLARDRLLRFRGRTLPVDGEVAHRWGELTADGRRMGRPLPVIDGLLLATASAHNLTFVTRNLRDCGDRGVPVLDPWA